jgi:predicted regulator of amino acid metabolism with ACT domain
VYRPIEKEFKAFPSRRNVAMAMLRHGLRVSKNGEIFCGDIELSPVKIGRVVGCDRRVVIDTARMIAKDQGLFSIFSQLRPTLFVGGGARSLGFGFIEIRADPNSVGLVARVTKVLAREGIMIRQIVADDPEIYPEPKLTIVTNGKLPPKVIAEIQKMRDIDRISLE